MKRVVGAGGAALVRLAWVAFVVGCSPDEGSTTNNSMCPPGMTNEGGACVPASAGQSGQSGGVAGSAGTADTAGTAGTMATAGTGAGASAGAAAVGAAGAGGSLSTAGTGGMMAAAGQGGAGDAGAAAGSGGSAGAAPPAGSTGCGASDYPQDGMQTIDVDGTQRAFIVEIPDDYDPSKPYKLIFAWHGLGGTASQISSRGFYGLRQRAAGTAIFVAGQGLDTSNSVGSGPGWDNMGGRDVAFTRAMLDYLRASYCIDEARIFSTGMSYGGIMSNTVGCALGDAFRAIAPIAGSGPFRFGRGATCTGQVAAWLAHGNTDTIVPFSAGQQSRDHWVQANGCDSATQPVGTNGCVAYQGCDDGHPVVWCEFDGGHTVPMFASAEIWEFFSQF